MSENEGWIAVDLDGTLAYYDGWRGEEHIGAPILPMVQRVRRWLTEGRDVRIFTARVGPPAPDRVLNSEEKIEAMRRRIEDWCEEHLGKRLPVTNEKDYAMDELWDDRCVQVLKNVGTPVGKSTRGLD
jgi:hypothetical protein